MTIEPTFWVEVPRDVVMVHGPDALSFAQGQLSQDVTALEVGQSAWSLVLQPTGKVDVFVRVLRSGDQALVLDTDGGWGERLQARLQRFKIRVKADIVPIDWRCVAVRGPRAHEVRATPGSVAVVADWHGFPGVDLLGPAVTPPDDLPAGEPADYERARVVAGWPAMGAELNDDTIPAETGVVPYAVSFTKGCYTGQELVERIDSRGGNVPRLLRRLVLPAAGAVAPGAVLRRDGKDCGWVTSVAGDRALGYVARAVAPPAVVASGDTELTVEAIGSTEP